MAALLRSIFKIPSNQSVPPKRFVSQNVASQQKSSVVPPEAIPHDTSKLSGKTHAVNNLEKRFLVWTGKYKNITEVPSWVTPESVEKARNKVRIRMSNYMMIATAFACLIMVISGKKAHERGENLQQANIEWHKRLHDEYEHENDKQNQSNLSNNETK